MQMSIVHAKTKAATSERFQEKKQQQNCINLANIMRGIHAKCMGHDIIRLWCMQKFDVRVLVGAS